MMKGKRENVAELIKKACQARQLMVEALVRAGCGHPGGAFSSIDLLVALFFAVLKIDPQNPCWPERDRFILSKGHSSIALYAAMHLRGFFDRDTLMTFRQDGSILAGHPDMRKVPGIEMSTGSLGHGLSVGIGLALSARLEQKRHRIFILLGDGETQEGSVWEAAMAAAHYRLDSLTAIVDRNRLQIDGGTEEVMGLEPYADKWRAFGWEVREIDGHDMHKIVATLRAVPFKAEKPSLVIAHTVKGKGISFMENRCEWHGKPLKDEYVELARRDVEDLLEKNLG